MTAMDEADLVRLAQSGEAKSVPEVGEADEEESSTVECSIEVVTSSSSSSLLAAAASDLSELVHERVGIESSVEAASADTCVTEAIKSAELALDSAESVQVEQAQEEPRTVESRLEFTCGADNAILETSEASNKCEHETEIITDQPGQLNQQVGASPVAACEEERDEAKKEEKEEEELEDDDDVYEDDDDDVDVKVEEEEDEVVESSLEQDLGAGLEEETGSERGSKAENVDNSQGSNHLQPDTEGLAVECSSPTRLECLQEDDTAPPPSDGSNADLSGTLECAPVALVGDEDLEDSSDEGPATLAASPLHPDREVQQEQICTSSEDSGLQSIRDGETGLDLADRSPERGAEQAAQPQVLAESSEGLADAEGEVVGQVKDLVSCSVKANEGAQTGQLVDEAAAQATEQEDEQLVSEIICETLAPLSGRERDNGLEPSDCSTLAGGTNLNDATYEQEEFQRSDEQQGGSLEAAAAASEEQAPLEEAAESELAVVEMTDLVGQGRELEQGLVAPEPAPNQKRPIEQQPSGGPPRSARSARSAEQVDICVETHLDESWPEEAVDEGARAAGFHGESWPVEACASPASPEHLSEAGSELEAERQSQLWPHLVDEEDLEREFDEEPEFVERRVEVRRGENARAQYQLGPELGRGKFGTVFRCTELASGRELAAKFVRVRREQDRADLEREVAIMCRLQHRRLLQLYDAFDDGADEWCLVTELVEGGELFERIVDDDFDLTERKAAVFVRQICEGVEYMHARQIVHLDMKPENILCLSRTGNRIKLIDFGLARELLPGAPPIRVMFGTPDFAAPEVLTYEFVSFATDMWSVGVICYVLLSGLSPFMGDTDLETMANVTRATFDFDDRAFEPISEQARDFIARLLVREPELRLKPAECLRHAWLQRAAPSQRAEHQHQQQHNQPGSPVQPGSPALTTFNLTARASLQEASQRPRASFGADSTASGLAVSLDKRRLKRYVVRRKWHKTVHAIMALGRMGAILKW